MEDVVIDEALVRSLLQEQHPDLAALEIREVPGGWDNQMWRLGNDLAVRMPRTPRAPELLRMEQQWLPTLAADLPLSLPVPVRVGEPSERFPRNWIIAKWVAGEPADGTPISRPEAADSLAHFLRALHRKAPADAPSNPTRGIPLQGFREDLEPWFSSGPSEFAEGARRVWEEALAAPAWDEAPVWLHGDLHPANVVVSDGTLSGVIDFGELCAGDPATDLSAAWILLPTGMASRFFDAYGDVDEATVQRSRGWAVYRAVGLIAVGRQWEQGLPGGKKTWGPAGQATLERLLVGQ